MNGKLKIFFKIRHYYHITTIHNLSTIMFLRLIVLNPAIFPPEKKLKCPHVFFQQGQIVPFKNRC